MGWVPHPEHAGWPNGSENQTVTQAASRGPWDWETHRRRRKDKVFPEGDILESWGGNTCTDTDK